MGYLFEYIKHHFYPTNFSLVTTPTFVNKYAYVHSEMGKKATSWKTFNESRPASVETAVKTNLAVCQSVIGKKMFVSQTV